MERILHGFPGKCQLFGMLPRFFLKITSLVALDKKTLKKLVPQAAAIARAEGLTAHAAAVERRMRDA